MKDKHIEEFIEDVLETSNLPKWIPTFRSRLEQTSRLPFLIIFQAVGICRSLPDKQAAIAITTKQLQEKGYLLKGSNTLSLSGEIRELSVLKSIGKKAAKGYLTEFSNL